jgi:hypothetical protein
MSHPIDEKPACSRSGMILVWNWSDKEIDKPNLLKSQLQDIQARGFTGVLACLGRTRYELVDRKVIRAAAQASQWAKKRGIGFWFQADPRRASRSIITATGEQTQHLLAAREHLGHLHPNLIRIRKNRFVMRIPFPRPVPSASMQEAALLFSPSGLERAFIMQITGGTVVSRTVRDITAETRLFIDASKGRVEVFGEVQVPDDAAWYALAFPRFDTNLVDYAGRNSIDRLMPLIEDFFESGMYLDGIVWDDPGFAGDEAKLPISPSLVNAFIAERGYDLRDWLPTLVFEFDDFSHIPVRHDYAFLLNDAVTCAMKDFYGMLHAFFGDVEILVSSRSEPAARPAGDPWRYLSVSTSGGSHIKPEASYFEKVAELVEAKSAGCFSKSQKAYAFLSGFGSTREERLWWMDAGAVFSVRWLVQEYGPGGFQKPGPKNPAPPEWDEFAELNRCFDAVMNLTGYQLPESDTLVLWPYETLTTAGPGRSAEMRRDIRTLTARLVLNGNQLDMVSSILFQKAVLDQAGLLFQNRVYQSVIYPYPDVMNPAVLELVFSMEKAGFPVLLGGTRPQWTCAGKRIPHDLPVAFDPKDAAFAENWQTGAERKFVVPENALGSVIKTVNGTLLLFCPKEPGGIMEGETRYQETEFHIPKSARLIVYRLKDGKVEKAL